MGRATPPYKSVDVVGGVILVVGFSGKIKSGKTTVAEAVASELGIARASFGDYVRSIAFERGLDDSDRGILQSIGESLIQSGWTEFCTAVLEAANWSAGDSIVVDGIRHQRAIATIKEIATPQPFCLVHVEVADELRLERLGKESSELAKMDAHSTEFDVKNILRSMADKCVDSSRDVDEVVAEICDFVRNFN